MGAEQIALLANNVPAEPAVVHQLGLPGDIILNIPVNVAQINAALGQVQLDPNEIPQAQLPDGRVVNIQMPEMGGPAPQQGDLAALEANAAAEAQGPGEDVVDNNQQQ